MRKSILLLILLVLPLIVGFVVLSDGGSSESSYGLKVLMLKESVMTPDVDLMDEGEVVVLEDEGVALGSADSEVEVDFNFIEELKFEKLYIINLQY